MSAEVQEDPLGFLQSRTYFDFFYLVCVHALELLFEINGGCTVIVERSAVNDSTCRIVSADFTFDLNSFSYNTSS
jgi:hypothetical protein